jgi:hypothetical protein
MKDPQEANSALPAYELPKRYLDPNFWARGPKSKDGAEFDKLIHIAVGHALSNWEHIESATALLFAHFVDSNSIAAQRAYGAIIGARGRQSALRQASETYFLVRRATFGEKSNDAIDAMEDCSTKLIHNYALTSGRRNDIAHGFARELSATHSEEMSWFLVAPNYQSQRTANWIQDDIKLRTKGLRLYDKQARLEFNKIYRNNSEYVYGVREIKTFAGKFAYLYADLLDFLCVMNPTKRRWGKTAQLHEMAKRMSD